MKSWIIKNIISPIAKFRYSLLCKIAKIQIEDAKIDTYDKGWKERFEAAVDAINHNY